jgi:hypothetical protein
VPVLRAGAAGVLIPALGNQQAFTLPSGAQQGDLIVIWITAASASNSFSATGFGASGVVSGGGGYGTLQILGRVNPGDAPGTQYTVTAANSDAWGGIIFAVGNEDQSQLYDGLVGAGAITSASVTTVTASSITLAYKRDLLVWLGMVVLPTGTDAITIPAGYTTQVTQVTGTIPAATNVSMIMATANAVGASGATGAVAGSVATSGITGGLLLAFPDPIPSFAKTLPRRRPVPAHNHLRRRQTVMIPQNTGIQFPLFIRQSGRIWNRPPWRVNRDRVFSPGSMPQGQLPVNFPTVTQQRRKQLNSIVQLSRMVRRPRVYAPGNIPQGPLPPLWVPQTGNKQPSWRRNPPRPRRGSAVLPIQHQQAQGSPAIMVTRQHPRNWMAAVRQPHKRFFSPPITQGPLPTGNPAIMRPARTRLRPWALRRLNMRSRIAMVPIPKRTQQATAHFTAPATMSTTAHVIHVPVVAFQQRAVLRVSGIRIKIAHAALTASTTLKVIAHVTHPATAHLSASTTLTATARKTRFGHAALTASTTLTATGVRSRGVALTAATRLTVAASATHPVTVALTARTVLGATAAGSVRTQEILIVPLAKPGVNEPPLKLPATSPVPVTEAVITATVKDELYDS